MTLRRAGHAAGLAVLFLSIGFVPAARTQESMGRTMLNERVVFIAMKSSTTLSSCLGFRMFNSQLPPHIELILTAAHCVRDLNPTADITVTSLSRLSGKGFRWFWSRQYDVGWLLVRAPAALSLGLLHRMSLYYKSLPPSGTQVEAFISIGGGDPTPAAGKVIGGHDEYVTLLLPGGHGTSGGVILGLYDGALVGTVVLPGPNTVHSPDEASYEVDALGAWVIMQNLNQNIDNILMYARQASPQ